MPQSFCTLYAHLIFSTKGRKPYLTENIRPRAHAYLATLARNMGAPYVVVGGTADHVHVFLDLGKSTSAVEFVRKLKKESSKFIKTLGVRRFYWQRGYGMFSVSPTHRHEAETYVENQVEHHRKRTFQEEFRAFLNRYGVEFDERYVWG